MAYKLMSKEFMGKVLVSAMIATAGPGVSTVFATTSTTDSTNTSTNTDPTNTSTSSSTDTSGQTTTTTTDTTSSGTSTTTSTSTTTGTTSTSDTTTTTGTTTTSGTTTTGGTTATDGTTSTGSTSTTSGSSSTSGQTGNVTSPSVTAPSLMLNYQPQGYPLGGDQQTIGIQFSSDVDLSKPVYFKFTVLQDGQPVAAADVPQLQLNTGSVQVVTLGADGTATIGQDTGFQLSGPGAASLLATFPSGGTYSVEVSAFDMQGNPIGDATTPVSIYNPDVIGSVETTSSEPFSNGTLVLQSSDATVGTVSVHTDNAGQFTTYLPAGQWTVGSAIDQDGKPATLNPQSQTITVTDETSVVNPTITVSAPLVSLLGPWQPPVTDQDTQLQVNIGPSISKADHYSLNIKVTDKAGNPVTSLASMNVWMNGNQQSVTTDPNTGVMHVGGTDGVTLQNTWIQLNPQFTAAGDYTVVADLYDVTTGTDVGSSDVTFTVNSPNVHGTVQTVNGGSTSGDSVVLQDQSGHSYQVSVDDTGHFDTYLTPGTWTVSQVRDRYYNEVSVISGGTIVVPETGTVSPSITIQPLHVLQLGYGAPNQSGLAGQQMYIGANFTDNVGYPVYLKVKLTKDGAPVTSSDMSQFVMHMGANTQQVVFDTDGTATVYLPNGTYVDDYDYYWLSPTFTKAGDYQLELDMFNVKTNQQVESDSLDIQVQSANVAGYVQNTEGLPIGNTGLRLTNTSVPNDWTYVNTDEQGHFSTNLTGTWVIDSVWAGNQWVNLTSSVKLDTSNPDQVLTLDQPVLQGTAQPNASIQLYPTTPDGQPDFSQNAIWAYADKDGNFTIALPAGNYYVDHEQGDFGYLKVGTLLTAGDTGVSKPLPSQSLSLSYGNSSLLTNQDDWTTVNLDPSFDYTKPVIIQMKVTNGTAPATGVSLSNFINDQETPLQLDANGTATIGTADAPITLSPDDHLSFRVNYGLPGDYKVTYSLLDPTTGAVIATDSEEQQVSQTNVILQAVDAGGNPTPDAVLHLTDSVTGNSVSISTDDSGTAAYHLDDGSWTVDGVTDLTGYPDATTESVPVTLTTSGEVPITTVHSNLVDVQGKVNGAPGSVEVMFAHNSDKGVDNTEGHRLSVWTDGNGNFSVGMAPGDWMIESVGTPYGYEATVSQPLTVQSGMGPVTVQMPAEPPTTPGTITAPLQVTAGDSNVVVHVAPQDADGTPLGDGHNVVVTDGVIKQTAAWNADNNDYEATFTETRAGNITFQAMADGAYLTTTAQTEVDPDTTVDTQNSYFGVPSTVNAGTPFDVVVHLQDQYGNVIGDGQTVDVTDGTNTAVATWNALKQAYVASFTEDTTVMVTFTANVGGATLQSGDVTVQGKLITFAGTVTEDGHTPASGATVTLFPIVNGQPEYTQQPILVTADANGAFSVQLPEGKYLIDSEQTSTGVWPIQKMLVLDDSTPASTTISPEPFALIGPNDIATGAQTQGTLLISPSASLGDGEYVKVTVTENGAPVTDGVKLQMYYAGGSTQTAQFDSTGTAELYADAPLKLQVADMLQYGLQFDNAGMYNVTFTLMNAADNTPLYTVTSFVTVAPPDVQGTLFALDGKTPLPDVLVHMTSQDLPGPNDVWLYTDDNGQFTADLPDGTSWTIDEVQDFGPVSVNPVTFTVDKAGGPATPTVKANMDVLEGYVTADGVNPAANGDLVIEPEVAGTPNPNQTLDIPLDAQGKFKQALQPGQYYIDSIIVNGQTVSVAKTIDLESQVQQETVQPGSTGTVPSKAPDVGDIAVVNNPSGIPDSITVVNLQPGDLVKVYDAATGGDLIVSGAVSSRDNSVTMSVPNLPDAGSGGTIYVSVTSNGAAESARTAKSFDPAPALTMGQGTLTITSSGGTSKNQLGYIQFNQTEYVPVFNLIQALEQAGLTASWDGSKSTNLVIDGTPFAVTEVPYADSPGMTSAYVSVSDVMSIFQSASLNATVTWDDKAVTVQPPTVNPVKDTDRIVTGTAAPGSTVKIMVGSQVLATTTAASDGKYMAQIPAQMAGTDITVIASLNGVDSAPTDVTVWNDECFIATAAFGSKFEPNVAVLRQFRDEYLLTNRPGRAFVRFYYRNSPRIADFIRTSGARRSVVRGMLYPFIGLAKRFVR